MENDSNKGRLIKFPGQFHTESQAVTQGDQITTGTVVDFKQKRKDRTDNEPEVFIPDTSAMYSPELITIGGVTVSELLKQIRSISNPEKSAAMERTLELKLFTARTRLIRFYGGPEDMYVELIMHTLGVADEFVELGIYKADQMRLEFRGFASQMASSKFGTRGYAIIAKHDLTASTYRNEHDTTLSTHQATPRLQKRPTPFKIVRPK